MRCKSDRLRSRRPHHESSDDRPARRDRHHALRRACCSRMKSKRHPCTQDWLPRTKAGRTSAPSLIIQISVRRPVTCSALPEYRRRRRLYRSSLLSARLTRPQHQESQPDSRRQHGREPKRCQKRQPSLFSDQASHSSLSIYRTEKSSSATTAFAANCARTMEVL